MEESKMIKLEDLNTEAREILEKAIPMNVKGWHENREYMDLYKEFNRATNFRYIELGFNKWQAAILATKRKKKINPFLKNNGFTDVLEK